MANKVFLSPERRPAPHGKYWGMEVYEHDVCSDIAKLLKPILEHNGFEVYIAPPEWSLGQRCTYANTNDFDYYLCIHSNAMSNGSAEGTATGCECLYYDHPASIKANQMMYEQLTGLYPSRRGIKDYSHFYENANTNMVSCYPELAFHDNGKDATWIVLHKASIAEALCKGVCGYFGVEYKPLAAEDKPNDRVLIEDLKAQILQLEAELKSECAARQKLELKINNAVADLTA